MGGSFVLACVTSTPGAPTPRERIDWIAPGVDTTARVVPRDSASAPTLVRFLIPPLPIPRSVLGSRVDVRFLVDAQGRIERITFAALPDREYTQALLKHFRTYEFRPATTGDGVPTRGYYLFSWAF